MATRYKAGKYVGWTNSAAPRPRKSREAILAEMPRGITVTSGELVSFPDGDPWYKSSKKLFRVDSTKQQGFVQKVKLIDTDTGLKLRQTVLSSVLAKVKIIRPASKTL